MANKYVNKIIYDGRTLIDLSSDTVVADKLLVGYKAHDKSGAVVNGSCTFDSNTQDATAGVGEILKGQTAYVGGQKLTGAMPNNSAQNGIISTKTGSVTIKQGYHDGSGKITIDTIEQAKIIPTNIREGVSILGVTGTMSGTEGEKAQSKTARPSTAQQTILPDDGYTCLSQVVVEAIPYAESDNAAGGITVTIG